MSRINQIFPAFWIKSNSEQGDELVIWIGVWNAFWKESNEISSNELTMVGTTAGWDNQKGW
jgi:hypothetical protein